MSALHAKKGELSWGGYILLLFAVCAASFAAVSLVNYSQGNSIIWVPDGEALYYNFFVYEGELLRSVLGSFGQPDFAIPLFSFDSGYGADILGTMAGCLNDPFNLISVFVPPEGAELALQVLTFVRFFLAALAFSVYARSKGNGQLPSLCGSLCYVLGGYVLFWGVLRHPNFLNEAILLPLLFYGADKVFQKKSPLPLIVTAAFQFFFSVYFSYMMLIVLVFYCVVKYCFAEREKTLRDFVGLLLRFVAYLLVAALIAGIAVVPLVLMLTSMGRVGVSREIPFFETFAFYWQYASNLLGVSLDDRGLFMGPVSLCSILVFLVAGKALPARIRWPWVIGLGICFVGSLLSSFGSVMNGFGYSTDRWMVAFSLCASYAVVLVVPSLGKISAKRWVVFFALVAAITALVTANILDMGWSRQNFFIVGLFVVVAVAMVLVGRARSAAAASGTLSFFAVLGAFVAVCLLSGVTGAADYLGTYMSAGEAYQTSRTIPIEPVKSELSESHRVDRSNVMGMRNQAFAQGFKGVDFFSSFYNQKVDDFRRSLGIADNHSNYVFNGHDQRFALEALTGAKYYLDGAREHRVVPYGYEEATELAEAAEGLPYALYETPFALPLAFVYDEAVSESTYDSLSMMERQELLTKACVIDGATEANEASIELDATVCQETSMTPKKGVVCEEGVIKVFEPGAKVVLRVEGEASAENSIVLENFVMEPLSPQDRYEISLGAEPQIEPVDDWQQLKWRPDASCNVTFSAGDVQKSVLISNSRHAGYGGKVDWAVNMGYSKKAVKKYVLKFSTCGIYTYDKIYIASQKVAAIADNVSALQGRNTAAISFGTNSMSVQVAAEEGKERDDLRYVFVSVPYSAGWSATLDGQPAEILKANVGFMAIAVDGASHDIQFTYCTPGLVAGAWCSVAGLILFIGIAVGRRQWAKRQNRKEQHEQDD